MDYTLSNKFKDEKFKIAFKKYFTDIKIQLNEDEWDEVFSKMSADNLEYAITLEDNSKIIAFILFQEDSLSNWFFSEPFGFIREFWVDENFRGNGIGSELLKRAEEYFKKKGISKIILTSDDAIQFYLKHGYRIDSSYNPKNSLPVLVKDIE